MSTTTIPLASDAADAEAARRVEEHHAQLAGRLGVLTRALLVAAREGDGEDARRELLGWLHDDLVPHASAEEGTLYPAAAELPEARLLVEAMLEEHRLIHRLVGELESAPDPVTAASVAKALETVFASHLAKENDQLVPVLVASPASSVAELLEGMHELLGGHEPHERVEAGEEHADGHAGHDCACGESDPAGHPELDARAVPHAIRHATIFGALDGVRPGAGLVLVAPHDPLPLLGQVEQRDPGAFEVRYLERGPEAWRLEFLRRA